MKHLITGISENLKASPLALALVLVNVLFLMWGVYMFNQFGEAGQRRDELIRHLVEKCR